MDRLSACLNWKLVGVTVGWIGIALNVGLGIFFVALFLLINGEIFLIFTLFIFCKSICFSFSLLSASSSSLWTKNADKLYKKSITNLILHSPEPHFKLRVAPWYIEEEKEFDVNFIDLVGYDTLFVGRFHAIRHTRRNIWNGRWETTLPAA